jgi:transposase
MQHMLDHPGERFDIAPFVDKHCKTPIEDIQRAVDGIITHEQGEKLRVILAHLKFVEEQKERIEQEILRLAAPYSAQLALIRTAPGFNADPLTAIMLLGEIGADMSVFGDAKRFVSWAGVCPANKASAGKKKSTRIGRGGQWLKPLLVQLANGLVKSEKHPEVRDRYLRLKARRGHKKALIAVCRMLLTAIWHILSKNEPYNAELYRSANRVPVDIASASPASRKVTSAEALAIVRRLGYTIADEVAPIA